MSETNPSNTSTSTNNKDGISIQDAMSILTPRAKSGGEKDALQAATPELKQLGQTLDLMNTQQWTRPGQTGAGPDCCVVPNDDNGNSNQNSNNNGDQQNRGNGITITREEEEQEQEQEPTPMPSSSSNGEGSSVTSRFRQDLSKLSPAEIISKLFELQNSRVAVYKQFNNGLEDVLLSGNLTSYPHLTTSITASFAVVSSYVRDIQAVLESRANPNGNGNANNDDIGGDDSNAIDINVVKFIKQLQGFEKEKLNLTAALHLEKIRERNERLDLELESRRGDECGGGGGGGDDETGEDDRVLRLLRQGISELQGKIRDYVEQINDVLEELRYASHDLQS